MCDLIDCKDCRHNCKYDISEKELDKMWRDFHNQPIGLNKKLLVDWEGWNKGTDVIDIHIWFNERRKELKNK